MNYSKYIPIVAVVMLFAGCTKEIPEEPRPARLLDVDLTGYWNGYGYTDLVGLVPLEIIEITREADGKYVATKIVGDNAVQTGVITWDGYFNSNPFDVDVRSGDGRKISINRNMGLLVVSENELRIDYFRLTFVRRTDGYFP